MGFRSLMPHLRPIYTPWVCASLSVSILAVSLPLSILEHGRSYGSISVVMGAGGVGAALGALRVGVLTDRWGSARVAAGALAVIAAMASRWSFEWLLRPLIVRGGRLRSSLSGDFA